MQFSIKPFALLGVLIYIAACGKPPAPAPEVKGNVYAMRGQIASIDLTNPDHPALQIHHEAIPDFVDMNGKKVGMGSMTMNFEVAPGVALGSLQAGDKIAFDFRNDWNARYMKIEKIVKLPAETELKFGPAAAAAEMKMDGMAKMDGMTTASATQP